MYQIAIRQSSTYKKTNKEAKKMSQSSPPQAPFQYRVVLQLCTQLSCPIRIKVSYCKLAVSSASQGSQMDESIGE